MACSDLLKEIKGKRGWSVKSVLKLIEGHLRLQFEVDADMSSFQ